MASTTPAFASPKTARCSIGRRRARLRFDPPLRVDDLDPLTREALGDALYPIFRASYGDLDRAVVCGEIIFRAGGLLCLLRDGHAIVGFGTACVHEVEVGGRVHGVFEGGIYCRRGVRGGPAWGRASLGIILAERLRHPLRPLHLVAELMTPVSYRLTHRMFARVYPTPSGHTPPALAAVLSAAIEQRGLLRPTAHPFVVCYPDPARPRHPDRIATSETLRDDPYVAAYIRQNPGYAEGHLLCAIIPLRWRDIAAAAVHQITRPFTRRAGATDPNITTTTRSH